MMRTMRLVLPTPTRLIGRSPSLNIRQLAIDQRRRYHEVSFTSPGEPEDVLEYHKLARCATDDADDPPHLKEHDTCWINVAMQHAPWNPADVNTVQGTYASPYQQRGQTVPVDLSLALRPSRFLPQHTVAGSEGWGRVQEVVHGSTIASDTSSNNINNEQRLQLGDWVALGQPGLGSLRSSVWLPANTVVPLKRGAELAGTVGPAAAAIFQLGGTALGLLREFVDLQPGDVVVQNAGNAGVAMAVSQLAAVLYVDVSVVSMVRRGNKTIDQWDELVTYMTETGKCSLVVAQEDLVDNRVAVSALKDQLRLTLSDTSPRLALNAVGGESSSVLLQLLGHGGTHVTYGGMSRKPVTVPTPELIFKDVRLEGYWHSVWMIQQSVTARQVMMNELVDLVLDGQLHCSPVEVFPLVEILHGVECAAQQSSKAIRSKVVFDCQEPA